MMLANPLVARLSVEDHLLLASARVTMSPMQAQAIPDLARAVTNWEHLLAMAHRHRVIPLLSRALRRVAPADVPTSVLETLRAEGAAIARRNLLLTRELLSLLKRFDEHGIRAVPIKGPVLAMLAYQDVSLRQFGDLDMLLNAGDVARARALLEAEGYIPKFQLAAPQEDAFITYQHDYPLYHSGKDIVLELHSGIKPKFYAISLDHKDLWAGLSGISIGGQQIPCLTLEDQLLTLCIHGTSHSWERLFWIVDIAELLSMTREVDWSRLLARARRLGCHRIVLLGLALAHDLLDAPLSEMLCHAIREDRQILRLEQQVVEQLFFINAEMVEGVKQFRFYMAARERWLDRVCYGLHLALDPTINDWKVLSLPSTASFLYYVIRPLRLMAMQFGTMSRNKKSSI